MRCTLRATAWLWCLAFVATSATDGRAQLQSSDQIPIPRTPDARPDFQGVWNFATLTPLERPKDFVDKAFLTDKEADDQIRRQLAVLNSDNRPQSDYNEFWFERPTSMTRVNGKNLTSRIIDPADGRVPPLTRAAQDRVEALRKSRRDHPADGPENRTMPERCLSPTPAIEPAGGGTNNLLQIVQSRDHLAVLIELMSVLRIIPIGRRDHLPATIRASHGDSVARWEGDTLVIDTTNYIGRFDFIFSAADENLHQIERMRLIDGNTLLVEVTIDDPTAFSKSWTSVLTLARANTRMFEYACHEGNYALKDILSGARAEEADQTRRPQQ